MERRGGEEDIEGEVSNQGGNDQREIGQCEEKVGEEKREKERKEVTKEREK